jgi:hypothetical protein
MKKNFAALLCAFVVLLAAACPALAAEPTDALKQCDATQTPAPTAVYPVEVHASEENGVCRLEKVYQLSASDDPSVIPTAAFEREGRRYELLDLLKKDQSRTDTKTHTEVQTLHTSTKDMAAILKLLKAELEVTTEDGYAGTLALDHTSIQVEAAGYGSRSYDVSATRTYPNLSDADTSLIPKSIEDGGRTLTLTDISWQNAAADSVDGCELALRYTAVATYSGTASSRYATGYVVTANYTGEVSKTASDTVVYTAVFTGTADGQAASAAKTQGFKGFSFRALAVPVISILLVLGGFLGYKAIKHYKNKKRGYEK